MLWRLVLDTNVWLDWLIFDDPGIAPARTAVASGRAEIFIDPACEQELVRVLAYPLGKKTLGKDAQAACFAECRRVVQKLDPPDRARPTTAEVHSPPHRLPVCRDPDDQKFLELARACRADFLVTRDRALLELARRKVQPAEFRIVTPRQIADALARTVK
jgi:putative PIN family toxin of toxin-antitoxin system